MNKQLNDKERVAAALENPKPPRDGEQLPGRQLQITLLGVMAGHCCFLTPARRKESLHSEGAVC